MFTHGQWVNDSSGVLWRANAAFTFDKTSRSNRQVCLVAFFDGDTKASAKSVLLDF